MADGSNRKFVAAEWNTSVMKSVSEGARFFVHCRSSLPDERAELSGLLVDADFFSFVPNYPETMGNSVDLHILEISATVACVALGAPIRLIAAGTAGTDRAACR